jgi:hypothetical protein
MASSPGRRVWDLFVDCQSIWEGAARRHSLRAAALAVIIFTTDQLVKTLGAAYAGSAEKRRSSAALQNASASRRV